MLRSLLILSALLLATACNTTPKHNSMGTVQAVPLQFGPINPITYNAHEYNETDHTGFRKLFKISLNETVVHHGVNNGHRFQLTLNKGDYFLEGEDNQGDFYLSTAPSSFVANGDKISLLGGFITERGGDKLKGIYWIPINDNNLRIRDTLKRPVIFTHNVVKRPIAPSESVIKIDASFVMQESACDYYGNYAYNSMIMRQSNVQKFMLTSQIDLNMNDGINKKFIIDNAYARWPVENNEAIRKATAELYATHIEHICNMVDTGPLLVSHGMPSKHKAMKVKANTPIIDDSVTEPQSDTILPTAKPNASGDYCTLVSEMAENVMQFHQNGVAMSKLYNMPVDQSISSLLKEMVVKAYDEPRFQTKSNQSKMVSQFRDDYYLSCVKAMDK